LKFKKVKRYILAEKRRGYYVEPFTEITSEDSTLTIITHIPGSFRESIRVEIIGYYLVINSRTMDIIYQRRIKLDRMYKYSMASFKNGVLKIILSNNKNVHKEYKSKWILIHNFLKELKK